MCIRKKMNRHTQFHRKRKIYTDIFPDNQETV